MYEGQFRREADYNRRGDRPSRVHGRPNRGACWGVLVAGAAVIAAAASAATADAQGGSGGASSLAECADMRFGDRPLQLGDCGDDVMTLNWVMKSKAYSSGVGLEEDFDDLTDGAVREFQERAGMTASGVVDDPTRVELKGSMKRRTATWYGPGFWGGETACGMEQTESVRSAVIKKR